MCGEQIVKGILLRNMPKEIAWILTNYSSYKEIRTSQMKMDVFSNVDLVIGYNDYIDKYIVWNALIHRYLIATNKMRGSHTCAASKKIVDPKNKGEFFGIKPGYYHPNGMGGRYEKYVVIEPAFLKEFCKAPFLYLMPDPEDDGYQKNTLFATPFAPEPKLLEDTDFIDSSVRERYSCSKAKRDAQFRQKVFAQYDKPHCVVCGNDCLYVLEAAHILSVKDGIDDSADNGVCLCRNHHALFDNAKGGLELDFAERTFCFSSFEVLYNETSAEGDRIKAGQKYNFV